MSLNCFFTQDDIKEIFEKWHCNAVDMLLLFFAASIDQVIGCHEQAPLTTVYTAYSSLLCSILFNKTTSKDRKHYDEIDNQFEVFQALSKHLLGSLDDENLFMLSFHALDCVIEEFIRFRDKLF